MKTTKASPQRDDSLNILPNIERKSLLLCAINK